MSAYRNPPSSESAVPHPPTRRARTWAVLALSLGAHVGVLGAGFLLQPRAPAPSPTAVVTVLSGHVDPFTGDLHAGGYHRARVRVAQR